jgi:hypothetical protein
MTPQERKPGLARREFIAGAATAPFMILRSSLALGGRAGSAAVVETRPAEVPSEETIYTGVSLEFVQLWDHQTRIRQTKELGLGNLVILATTFHLGSEEDRRRWKELYPALAEQIDKTPTTTALHEVGSPVILEVPEEILIEQARLCRENGLYFGTAAYLAQCKGRDCTGFFARLKEVAGRYWLSHSMLGEHTSVLSEGWPASLWKSKEGLDLATMNPQRMRDWFVSRDRKAVLETRDAGVPMMDNVEATAQFRLALAAGVNCPILELVPAEPLSGLAAVRGAAKAYGSALWGVSFALGWYRPPVDSLLPNRIRIAYNLFYAGGARLFYDVNDYFHIYSLGAGWFADPRPPARMGEREYRGFDDPICVAGRKVLQDHYRFVQFHDRPKGGPKVNLGFVLGHLDGYTGSTSQSHVWGVHEAAWEAGDAEKTWQYFHRLYDAEPWYTPPLSAYWQNDPVQTVQYGTPPCGQVDIVPVEAPLQVLQTYSCLVFLGWNTITGDVYEKLTRYVRAGGRLFMSVPQLSSQVERKGELALIRGGDYGDLFGARIVGAGEQAEAVRFVAASGFPSYQFPQGATYREGIRLAKAETRTAAVLAATPQGFPVLLENRAGKGFAYLLTTWGYPGLHLQRFMTDLLRTISNGEQDRITVEGDSVFYAVYGKQGEAGEHLTTVYLVNRNLYGLPEYGRVAVDGKPVLVRVEGCDMRTVWNQAGLIVSPLDRFVKVERVQAARDGYVVDLVAEKGTHRVQLAHLGREIDRVRLEGTPQILVREEEKSRSFESRMQGKQQLTVQLR